MMNYRYGWVFIGLFCLLSACKLIDQRTFNQNAGRRPIPYIPPASPLPPPPAPPIEIVMGTPIQEWNKPLHALVKMALQKKADALFIISVVTPKNEPLSIQENHLRNAIHQDAQQVADAIIKSGVRAEQILMDAKTNNLVSKTVIQVNVK